MKLLRLIVMLSLGCSSLTHGLVLENLIEKKILQKTLENKTLGYYIGSFDPVHLGHMGVANAALTAGCDYVLVCPVWGGDGFKNRTLIEKRLDMLFLMFRNHSKIIVTRMNPQNVQRALTKIDPSKNFFGRRIVNVDINGLKIWGVMGSDALLDTLNNKKKQSVYMRGLEISEKYKENSAGTVIALPAEAFIVMRRKGIEGVNGVLGFGGRKVVFVDSNDKGISSTQIRKLIKDKKPTGGLLPANVRKYIDAKKLY